MRFSYPKSGYMCKCVYGYLSTNVLDILSDTKHTCICRFTVCSIICNTVFFLPDLNLHCRFAFQHPHTVGDVMYRIKYKIKMFQERPKVAISLRLYTAYFFRFSISYALQKSVQPFYILTI